MKLKIIILIILFLCKPVISKNLENKVKVLEDKIEKLNFVVEILIEHINNLESEINSEIQSETEIIKNNNFNTAVFTNSLNYNPENKSKKQTEISEQKYFEIKLYDETETNNMLPISSTISYYKPGYNKPYNYSNNNMNENTNSNDAFIKGLFNINDMNKIDFYVKMNLTQEEVQELIDFRNSVGNIVSLDQIKQLKSYKKLKNLLTG
jgi:hypothetical protein